MKKDQFKNLIYKEVKKILEEAARAEAPADAPFGKYLWANPGEPGRKNKFGYLNYPQPTSMRIRKDKTIEPNTEAENDFLNYYLDYVRFPDRTKDFEQVITKYLRPAKAQGVYSQYINPPNVPLYRGLTVSANFAARLLRLPIKEFKTETQKAWYVSGGGALNTRNSGKKIMSWTIDPRVAFSFSLDNESSFSIEHLEGSVAIVLVTNPSNGDFYLNPENLLKKFNLKKISALPAKEKEVISYGPVQFTEAAFISFRTDDLTISRTEKNKISRFVGNAIDNVIANLENVKIEDFQHFTLKDVETIEKLISNENVGSSIVSMLGERSLITARTKKEIIEGIEEEFSTNFMDEIDMLLTSNNDFLVPNFNSTATLIKTNLFDMPDILIDRLQYLLNSLGPENIISRRNAISQLMNALAIKNKKPRKK